jgi:AcrR family transcriptional regulator
VLSRRHAELDTAIPSRLIEAAAEMFARHGYAATRVREIVRAADVDLSAVNYYFGGKEGLYAATLKELAASRGTEPSPGAPGSEAAEDALYRQVLAILRRFVAGDGATLGRILAHESLSPTDCFDALVADSLRPEFERLGAIVKRLAGAGADEATIAHAAASVMGQCLFHLFARGAFERLLPEPQRKDWEALARHITGFSLMGIAVHSTRHERR